MSIKNQPVNFKREMECGQGRDTCQASLLQGPYRYYVLGLLSLVCALAYMDRFVLSVLVEPIKHDLNFSDTQMGLLTGFAFALFYAAFGVPVARLADRMNRSRIVSISVILWSLMTAACGLAGNFVQLLLARMGVGVGEAGCIPPSHALLGDMFPPHKRAFAIGLFQAGGTLGVLAGLMLGGMLAMKFGWQTTFLIIGLPGVLVGMLVWMTVKDPFRELNKTTHRTGSEKFTKVAAQLFRIRSYRHVMLGVALGNFGTYGVVQWLPAFLIRSHGMALDEIGLWYGAVVGIGSLTGTLTGAVLSPMAIARDRRWEILWAAVAYFLSAPLFVVSFLVDSQTLSLGLLFVAVFVLTSGNGPVLASLQSMVSSHMRATAVALAMLASAVLGQGAGPLIVGLLSDFLSAAYSTESLRYALCFSMLIMLWAGGHLLWASRHFKNDVVG